MSDIEDLSGRIWNQLGKERTWNLHEAKDEIKRLEGFLSRYISHSDEEARKTSMLKSEKALLEDKVSSLESELKDLNDKIVVLKNEKVIFETKRISFKTENSELSKKISELEIVLEKERVDFEAQRKAFEVKNGELTEKISEIQMELDRESEEHEKMKKADFQAKSVKNDFSVERKIFQQEIQKLIKNLASLSTDIMKEKRTSCDIRKKLDLMIKERNDLSDKVRSFNKSECYSECPMRPSNIFYKHSVDKSSKSFADLPSYKRVNMKWKVKGKFPEKDVPKSSFPNKNFKTKVNSFVNSYCGNYDFVNNNSVQYWYGTYHFPSYRAPLNVSGPKTRWVPKST